MNKYLEKVAGKFSTLVKDLRDNRGAVSGGVAGAATFGYIGSHGKTRDSMFSKTREKTKAEKIMGGIGGVLSGAYMGAVFGGSRDLIKGRGAFNEAFKARSGYYKHRGYHYGGGGEGVSSTRGKTISDIHKDLGASSGFKTKSEAQTHFRRQASKWHPDKHIGPTKDQANKEMQKINSAWTQFKSHPEGFEKLANAYLVKAASMFSTGFKKGKDLIRNKPMTAPIKGANIPGKKPALTKPTGL